MTKTTDQEKQVIAACYVRNGTSSSIPLLYQDAVNTYRIYGAMTSSDTLAG